MKMFGAILVASFVATLAAAIPCAHARDGNWHYWDYPDLYFNAVRDPARQRLLVVQFPTNRVPLRLLAMAEAGPFLYEEVPTLGAGPRASGRVFMDPTHDALLVLTSNEYLNATSSSLVQAMDTLWTLSLATSPPSWSAVAIQRPLMLRLVGNGFLDPAGSRLVFFDTWDDNFGYQGSPTGFRKEVWALRLGGAPSWTMLTADHGLPENTENFWAFDPDGRRLLSAGWRYSGTYLPPSWEMVLREFPLDAGPQRIVPPVNEDHPTAPRNKIYRDDATGRIVSFRSNAGGGWRVETIAMSDSGRITQVPLGFVDGLQPENAYFIPFPGGAWAAFHGGRLYRFTISDSARAERVLDEHVSTSQLSMRSLAFDPRREVFRGNTPSNAGWWELAGDPPVWTSTTRQGSSPSIGAAAWDPVGRQYMGIDGSGRVALQAEAGTGAWSMPVVTGTPPWPSGSYRTDFSYSLTYDARNDRFLVVGGLGELTSDRYPVRAWELRLRPAPAWKSLASRGAVVWARKEHGLTYDSMSDRLYLFGGTMAADAFNHAVPPDSQLYEAAIGPGDTLAWTSRGPAGAPFTCRLIADPREPRLLVVGGSPYNNYLGQPRVFESRLDGDPTLRALDGRSDTPVTEQPIGLGYDARRDRIVYFGSIGGNPGAFELGWPLGDITPGVMPAVPAAPESLDRGEQSVASCRLSIPSGATRVLRVSVHDERGWFAVNQVVSVPRDSSGASLVAAFAVPDTAAAGAVTVLWQAEYVDVPGMAGTGSTSLFVNAVVDSPDVDSTHVDPPAAAPASFWLERSGPNPVRSAPSVAFSLPDGSAARLEVFDVRGRLCWSRDVGVLGAGRHVLQLEGAGSPGLYWARLQHASGTRITRFVRL